MEKALAPAELEKMLNAGESIQVLDVRLTEDRVPVAHDVPGACWRDPDKVEEWAGKIDKNHPVVVYCVHGLRVSRSVRQKLSDRGYDASILEGGIDAWQEHVKSAGSDPNQTE